MGDHLFPRYHVRPRRGYLNDPNGPIVIDGVVHLYYQYRHTLDHASPVLWGHVTSRDLVHWELHRPALTPHPSLDDRDGCWSGNTVLDDRGHVRAFYSGYVTGGALQATLTAQSTDGGFSFGPPLRVIDDPPAADHVDQLRDPFVWREGSSWRMVVGTSTGGSIAGIRMYASEDLDTWSYVGLLSSMPRTIARQALSETWDSGAMWECPQIVDLDGRRLALVGSWSRSSGVMDVLSLEASAGPAAREQTPSTPHLVDHGPNFYAASVLRDSPWGAIAWGWATEGRSAASCEDDGWSGLVTLPRQLSLREDGSLGSSPLPGLSALRAGSGTEVPPAGLTGLSAQLEILVELPEQTTGVSSMRLCFGDDEYLELVVDREAGVVVVDRVNASRDAGAERDLVTIPFEDGGGSPPAAVRAFVDGSILELFLPGARVATVRFYPTAPPPWRLKIQSHGGGEPPTATVWELAAAGTDEVSRAGRTT